MPNAIVIVVDRLGPGYLGPYGNTWVETPALNRLASQSLLWEQMISTSPILSDSYRSYLTGRHPLVPESSADANFAEQLAQLGVRLTLLTDDDDVASSPLTSKFAELHQFKKVALRHAADQPEETGMGLLFADALEWLDRAQGPFCLWIHSRGMQGEWDAPFSFREDLRDEDDPEPPNFVEPPNLALGDDPDPDQLLGFNQAYAAQVVLFDMCLEMLLDHLQERGLLDSTLIILTSPRGYSLGERGFVGANGDSLHEEVVHLPLLVRRPDKQHAMIRCQSLVELADLPSSLGRFFGVSESGGEHRTNLLEPTRERAERPCVVSSFESTRAIRTDAWLLHRDAEGVLSLYAKPDDRWEVNEVAARCGEVVEELSATLSKYEELARENRLRELPPLSEQLRTRTD